MNLQRLQSVLSGFGLGSDVVQFGGLPNEAFVIEPHAGGWRIFYSERGVWTGEAWFENESDAADAFLELLASDSSIRFDSLRLGPMTRCRLVVAVVVVLEGTVVGTTIVGSSTFIYGLISV
jgi:hypothetical protein